MVFKPAPPTFVILIYESWQKSYDIMQEQKLIHLSIKGLDNMEYLKELFEENKNSGGTLIIFDDQMQKVDYNLVNIFTIYSHHLNVTCLLLTQSLFLSNKIYRVLSLNTHYIVLMKNTRDSSSVSILAKQTHPFRTRFVTDAFLDATKEPFSYLVMDLHQETDEKIRLRSNISSDLISIYVPNS